ARSTAVPRAAARVRVSERVEHGGEGEGQAAAGHRLHLAPALGRRDEQLPLSDLGGGKRGLAATLQAVEYGPRVARPADGELMGKRLEQPRPQLTVFGPGHRAAELERLRKTDPSERAELSASATHRQ